MVACWTPFFGAQERDIFREIAVTPWTNLQETIFHETAHLDSLCSSLLETIFRKINTNLPVNADWNTCCAMVSHAKAEL